MIRNIVWREGLFMKPQHFQQNSFYMMAELMQRTRSSAANMWGIFDLEIDKGSLSLGKVLIRHISGLMPDGTLFDIVDSEQLLGREIKESDVGEDLYLSLPLAIANSKEVFFEYDEEKPTRYFATSISDIPNLNIGEESKADLTFSEFNFKILKKSELKEGYTFVKITRVKEVSADGQVSLDNTYEPTYMHLNKARTIMTGLQDIIATLQYRSEQIAVKLGNNSLETTELGDYLMLQLVNKAYSRLHYFTTQSQLHPADLFVEMNSIIAELAVFLKTEKRIVLPLVYSHLNQNGSFKEIFSELKTMLNFILEKNAISLELQKGKYGLYRAKLPNKGMIRTDSFILSVSSKLLNEGDLKKLLLDNLKISTVEGIQELVNLHLSGFKVSPLASAPRQIPYRVDNSYFKIILGLEDKNSLEVSGGFAFYLPELLQRDLGFTLWAIKDK